MTTSFDQMLANVRASAWGIKSDKEAVARMSPELTKVYTDLVSKPDPFAILIAENPAQQGSIAGPTLGSTCTFNPWDGCSADID